MCIIMSKPAEVDFPDILTLRNCWENNPHGAGYAVANKGKVYIRKGFMTWEEFMESVNFDGLVPYSCVFHFRFATHGSKSPGNCHPFPVSGNMKMEKIRTDVAIVHNGVIPNIMITERDYSDTMTYIEETIQPFWEQCKVKRAKYMYSIKKNQDMLKKETNSKWSFLFGDGKIINVGKGVKRNGIWYSNEGFEATAHRIRRVRQTADVAAGYEALAECIKSQQFAAGYCNGDYYYW